MRVLLLQLDGKGAMPNLALMRIAAHHRARGDQVELRKPGKGERSWALVERGLFDQHDQIYASLIFQATRPIAERLRAVAPRAIIGGTGWDLTTRLAEHGIDDDGPCDYTVYPDNDKSIGFSQRGCRLACEFCVVPVKEGKIREIATIRQIWRGDGHPKHILLLDNDFFGQKRWPELIDEMIAGGYKVSFNQGINARMLNRETAGAIARVKYRDDSMKRKRIYTAWDNKDDERTLFRGLTALAEAGVKPDDIMVYMLIGYWAGETRADREHRRRRLRDFGARPYPMPYVRTWELRMFQKFCCGAYDKSMTFEAFLAARGEPRNMTLTKQRQLHLPVIA